MVMKNRNRQNCENLSTQFPNLSVNTEANKNRLVEQSDKFRLNVETLYSTGFFESSGTGFRSSTIGSNTPSSGVASLVRVSKGIEILETLLLFPASSLCLCPLSWPSRVSPRASCSTLPRVAVRRAAKRVRPASDEETAECDRPSSMHTHAERKTQ